jgi:translation initiation factor 2B subunit (eIF-2B alpha/beta/delta family)
MPEVAGDRDEGWVEIRRAAEDRASGAAEIARRAASALSSLPRSDLEEAVRTLVRGHPSMAPLWRLGSAVLSSGDHSAAAADFAGTVLAEREAVAGRARSVLAGPVVTLSYSSTLVAAVAAAGGPARCAVSQPGGEGAVTAERLRGRGVEAEAVDDATALDAATGGVTVVTGADAIGPGGVVNKFLTRAMATGATGGGGACYAVAGGSKFLAADLPAPKPFERTPLSLFTAILTEEGLLGREEAARWALAHPLHPALVDLLAPLG